MANPDNHEQGFIIMSEMEERAAQTGTTAICHLYVAKMRVGKKQGVLQSFEDLQN